MSKLEDAFTKKDLQEMLLFAETACNVLKNIKRGTEVEFKCPICGGKAHAGASTYNGHRHGKCESCGQAFIE